MVAGTRFTVAVLRALLVLFEPQTVHLDCHIRLSLRYNLKAFEILIQGARYKTQ